MLRDGVRSEDDSDGGIGDAALSIAKQRAKTTEQRLADLENGVESYEFNPKSVYYWLYTIERSLRYSLCDKCVSYYLKDNDKISELANGYVMLSLLLCPKCAMANVEVKRAWKHGFGKPWFGGGGGASVGRQGGGGGYSRGGGWGGRY